MKSLIKSLKGKRQLEFELSRRKERDRNFLRGGRSFYFFDFDDNVATLTTPIVLFHKDTGREVKLSSGEFARESGILVSRAATPSFLLTSKTLGLFDISKTKSSGF